MSNTIGSAVIEVSADSRKLTAGIDDAKKSLKDLGIAAGNVTKGQSKSIDSYIKSLGVMAVTTGKTGRELELYKLALRGASAEQLKAADSALRMTEAYAKGEKLGNSIRTGAIAAAAAVAAATIASAVAFDQLVKKAGDYQDMAEKIGDSAQNVASLAVAAGTAGVGMDAIVSASTKLTKGLTGVDDESKAAGAALTSLGLSIKDFKNQSPTDQIESVAKALSGFEDGATKTAVAMALFGKSGAELLPFLKELGAEGGRQVILTEKQIQQADEYADKQAKLAASISLHAQSMASEMVPAVTQLTDLMSDLAKDQAFAATASDILKGAIGGATVVLQTIAIVASDVGFVFQGVGREIGAIIAQLAALASGDLRGFNAISDAVKEDAARARLELDKFQSRLMSVGAQATIGQSVNEQANARLKRQGAGGKPTLSFNGVDPKAKDEAKKEAKAQLSLDLENIRIGSESTTRAYSNGEKIMEALRSAGLINEQEYYASKLDFLKLNGAAEEQALADQIRRLESEKLIGAAKIENDKKIAETRAKLAAAKATNATGVSVLGIQGDAASSKRNQEVEDFFRKAEEDSKNRSISGVEKIRQSLLTEFQVEVEMHAARMQELEDFNAARLEGEAGVNDLIEAEKQRHNESLISMQMQKDQMILSAASSATEQMYDILKQAGMEQTALGKVAFIASKALAVAQIILSTNVAAAAALSLPPIGLGPVAGLGLAGFITTMGYASAGMTAGLAIAEASAKDGYDIPEGQNPVVQTHAKEMILPRAQANVIRDLAKDGGDKKASSSITIVNNTSAKIAKVTEQTLSNGERALIIEEAVAATAAQFSDPNSKTSRALSRNYSTQRSR